jgi:hypothetical protein
MKSWPAAQALGVFLGSLVVAAAVIARVPGLGTMGGTTDEHFALGLKLRVNGTLGITAGEPSALRPPGYPALVAAATAAFVSSPAELPVAVFEGRAEYATYLAQGVLLAAGSALLFLWLRPRTGAALAAGAALAFASAPAVVVLCTLLHYSILHAVALVAVCAALERAVAGGEDRSAVLAGFVTGAANLVRPVTLWLPAFAFAALWVRFGPRKALRAAAVVAVASALVVVPWTVRNLRVTGRLLPVGDTGWMALWGPTAKPLVPDPDRYAYFDLYFDILRVFQPITGLPRYDYPAHARHAAALEGAFREEALANLKRQPGVYAANVVRGFATLVARPSTVFVSVAGALRARPGPRDRNAVPQEWLRPGAPDVGARWLALATSVSLALLGGLAAAGIVASALRREPFGLAVAAVVGCVLLTHSLVFVSMMHHYLRLPFLFAGAAVALREAETRGGPLAAAAAAAALLAVLLSTAVTTALVFAPA